MAAVTTSDSEPDDLAHVFVLPTLLFAALGAMTWAVRGTAGASAMNAHIAPGLTWGAAWWFLARDRGGRQSRRYASGWILLAVTVGFAIAGDRGWVQWAHFFEGQLSTNYARGQSVPISPAYGFFWLFFAGAAWAGLPACFLAWCGYGRPTHAWEWTLRIACGLAGGYLAWRLFVRFPEFFLPLYHSIEDKYHDFRANPSLARLYRDNGATVRHAGYCLGFLAFEAARRDWKNVTLISTVGVLNGLGWAACQNWKWAARVWPDANFNFWRCWECCGGIGIGIAFGVAYYLVNRKKTGAEATAREWPNGCAHPHAEWLLAAGLLLLVGWTAFWPAAKDLRQDPARVIWSMGNFWGGICIVTGVALAAGALAHRLLIDKRPAGRRIPQRTLRALASWIEITLMLVLGWFIRNEVNIGFGDGVRVPSRSGWLGPGNLYYGIVAAYCFARLDRALAFRERDAAANDAKTNGNFTAEILGGPWNLDWLATYLGLGVILISAIGVNMTTWWMAPVWFGIVGAAYGVGYYLLKSSPRPGEVASELVAPNANGCAGWNTEDPNLERWGAFVGLLYGLGLSLRKMLKGGANVYLGNEKYWDVVCWNWVALAMLACMLMGMLWFLYARLPRKFQRNALAHASGIIWLVLIVENVVAQVVTGPVFGPRRSWNDFLFNLLYLMLFAMTAVIIYHFQFAKSRDVLTS